VDCGAEDGSCSSGVDTAGAGDGLKLPVPGKGSLRSGAGIGTGVMMISRVEVTVVGRSGSLVVSKMLFEELEELSIFDSEKSWLNAEVRSNLRDSSELEELESEDVSWGVGAAGPVVLVTIWRLMCRGK
jgi:hypothetical protein